MRVWLCCWVEVEGGWDRAEVDGGVYWAEAGGEGVGRGGRGGEGGGGEDVGAGDVADVDEVEQVGVAANLEARLAFVVDLDKVGDQLAVAGPARWASGKLNVGESAWVVRPQASAVMQPPDSVKVRYCVPDDSRQPEGARLKSTLAVGLKNQALSLSLRSNQDQQYGRQQLGHDPEESTPSWPEATPPVWSG